MARNTDRPSDFLSSRDRNTCIIKEKEQFQRGVKQGDGMETNGCREIMGFLGCASDSNPPANAGDERCRFHPLESERTPEEEMANSLQHSCPKSCGQRSLAVYPPRDCKTVRQDLVTKQLKVITLQLSAKAFLRNQHSSLDLTYEK